jgi:hypothetical protein
MIMKVLILAGNRLSSMAVRPYSQAFVDTLKELVEFSEVVLITDDSKLREIENLSPRISSRIIPQETAGALTTAAFGLQDVSDSSPFLIIPSNSKISTLSIKYFREAMSRSAALVGAVVFEGSDPLYSYARVDNTGQIVEIVEKEVSGSCALAGYYYFKDKELFARCVEWALVNNVQREGKFFLSPALNYFLANSMEITLYEIAANEYSRLEN